MKNTILLMTLITLTIFSCADEKKGNRSQKNENQQNKTEWINLFDGKSFDGWHRYNQQTPSNAWQIKDNTLMFNPELVEKGDYVHDLVTDKEFTNFELSLEWKLSPGGNSGIFWGVKEGAQYATPYITGPEIQVFDDSNLPENERKEKKHQAAALYDLVAPKEDKVKPAGEWNKVLLTINHKINKGSVIFNGVLVTTFPLSGPDWEAMVSQSKFATDEFKDFGKYKTGKIALQDHGDQVHYRNIKIRPLP